MAIFSGSKRDHRFASERLSAYLDGALTAREVARLEQHLAQCEACRRDLATLRSTLMLLRRIPLRPSPRSFALPRSVQPQQASYRRWNLAFSFLQTATVAVATVLIVMVSGSALFSMGAIPTSNGPTYGAIPASETALPPAPAPVAIMAQPEKEVAIAHEEAKSVSVVEAPAEAAPIEQPQTEAIAESEASLTGQSATEAPQAQLLAQADAAPTAEQSADEARVEATAATNIGPLPRTAGAHPQRPTTASASGVGGGEGGIGGVGEASGAGAPADSSATTGGGENRGFVAFPTERPPVTPLPTPTTQAKRAAQPTLAPPPSPTAVLVARAITQEAQPQAPIAPLAAEEPAAQAPSLLWRVWKASRLTSLALVGVLCVLAAGLLWTGYKKRM